MFFVLIICHEDSFVPSDGLVAENLARDGRKERRAVRKDGQPLRATGSRRE